MPNARLDASQPGIKRTSSLRYGVDTTRMAESQYGLKTLLRVKEKGGKADFKLNIQITEIMASCLITS